MTPKPPEDVAEVTRVWKEELKKVARDAFSFMAAGQRLKVRIVAAEKRAAQAGRRFADANMKLHVARREVQGAREEQKAAAAEHAAAAEALGDARALAQALAEKRRRRELDDEQEMGRAEVQGTVDDAASHGFANADLSESESSGEDGPSFTAVPDHPRVAKYGLPNPPHWRRFYKYTHATFQNLEVQEMDRRAVPLDRSRSDIHLPAGDENRGWFGHWRRGVGPVLRGWANGSLGAVIHMLAEAVRRFDIVEEVGAALGLHTREAVRHSETCAYICDRLRDSLSTLKWARTEEQRVDYHVVLGAIAPKPNDGMTERVAEVLGVTSGSRCSAPPVSAVCAIG